MSRTMFGLPPPSAGRRSPAEWACELAPLGERSLKVVWDISNKCNLRCRMCHFAFDEVFHRPAEYTTPAHFERFAAQVLPHAHTLILSAGNEPMTSPWFAEILAIAGRYRLPNLLFITNATRMTPAIAEAILDAGVTQVQVSIDGCTPATYEHIRTGARFDRTVANIRHLTARRQALGRTLPQLQFNIVLMRRNLEELEGFVDLAEDLGVEWIAARHLLVMKGLGMESESLAHVPELANAHFARFLERAERSPLVRVISFPDLFDIEKLRATRRERRLVDFESPFGMVDLPAAGADVDWQDGRIQLAGWALGREKLVGVVIQRQRLPGDDAADTDGWVALADARCGIARGDVGALYPEFDDACAAGWSCEVGIEAFDVPPGTPVRLRVVAHALDGRVGVLGERVVAVPGLQR